MKHKFRKRWGQNFLSDTNLLNKVVRIIDPQPTDRILEIGPGEGALTELLAPEVSELIGIEIDNKLFDRLQSNEILSNCSFINKDFLDTDLRSLSFSSVPVRVVGNIPYNITSPIIFKLIAEVKMWSDIHIMMQKEVADRLTASVGSRDYGRLTVMVRTILDVKRELIIPSEVFIPKPTVSSALISMIPHNKFIGIEKIWNNLSFVVKAAFSQRRKMLRNSLKEFQFSEDVKREIDFSRRPETLTVTEFIKLAKELS